MKITIEREVKLEQEVIDSLELKGCTVMYKKGKTTVTREYDDTEMKAFDDLALSPVQWCMEAGYRRLRKHMKDLCKQETKLNPANATPEELKAEVGKLEIKSAREREQEQEQELARRN